MLPFHSIEGISGTSGMRKAESPGCRRHHFHGMRRSWDLPRVALMVCMRPSRHTLSWMLRPAGISWIMRETVRAFDALSVDFHHHVIFLKARLCRGTVWNDLS